MDMIWYRAYHVEHIIWAIRYGPFHMTHDIFHIMCFLTLSCAWARFSKNLVASNTDTAWSKVFFSKFFQFTNFTYRHLSPIPCKNYKNVTNRFWILHSLYDRTCLYVPLIETLSEVRLISWDSKLISWVSRRKIQLGTYKSIEKIINVFDLHTIFINHLLTKMSFQIDSDSLTNQNSPRTTETNYFIRSCKGIKIAFQFFIKLIFIFYWDLIWGFLIWYL